VLVERGVSQSDAARAVGVQRQTVNIWLKRYRAQGDDGVLDGRRVSPRRGKGVLTAEEAKKVRRWIADKMPDQLKLPFALWTARAVLELIEQRFGKRLGLSTVQLYLERWGLSPQKPLARARERSPAAIAAWLERDYPLIARKAKAEKAAIYWGDETGILDRCADALRLGKCEHNQRPDGDGGKHLQAGRGEHHGTRARLGTGGERDPAKEGKAQCFDLLAMRRGEAPDEEGQGQECQRPGESQLDHGARRCERIQCSAALRSGAASAPGA
jgi:transposase